MLLGSEEADVVVNQNVSLHLIGEVPTGYELHPGSRADLVGLQDAGSLHIGPVACLDHAGEHPGKACARGVEEEVLTVVVKSQSPWVGYAKLGVSDDGLFLRAVTVEAPVGCPLRTECGFDVTMEENALTHDESSRRIGAKSGDGMVGIVVVEA